MSSHLAPPHRPSFEPSPAPSPGHPPAEGPDPPFGSRSPLRPSLSPLSHRSPHPPPAHPVGILPAVQSLLYVLVVALFLITFTVQPIRIPSSSMEPTLLVGDFLLLDKQATAPGPPGLLPPTQIRRGDVIVFHDPIDDPSIHLVKRVIGLPGDRLHLRDGVVFVNGKPLRESYAVHRPAGPDTFRDDFPLLQTMDAGIDPDWWIRLRGLIQGGEITVPANHFFVLGDNRNDSADSRYWGFVPRAAIVGKPLLIYFSWNRPPANSSTAPTSDAPRPSLTPSSSNALSGLAGLARWDRTFRVIQ